MSPDGSTKPLPEERLLKLIREKAPRPRASALAPQGSSPEPGGVAPRQGTAQPSQLPWPTLVAGGLGLVVALEACFLMVQLIRPVPPIPVPTRGTAPAGTAGSAPASLLEMPSLAHSAPPALFQPPTASPTAPVGAGRPTGGPSARVKQLAARLTLMGIVAGDPAQAIIEDAQTKKTYFVTSSQPVVEGAILEQVLENRVVLDVDGEKIELTL